MEIVCKKCNTELNFYEHDYHDFGSNTYVCTECMHKMRHEMEREFIERKYPELFK